MSFTWGTHGTLMHYGKMASRRRQCDALGNVLPGNLESCHPCGCYFDTYHLPKHCCRPLHPFMEMVLPDGCGLFQQDNAQCHKSKMVQEWFGEHNNKLEVFSRSQSNQASVGRAGQTNAIHEGPTSQLTALKGSAANILMPDTTAHLRGSSGIHASIGHGLFWQQKGNQHNIRQVVMMLCLMMRWEWLLTDQMSWPWK